MLQELPQESRGLLKGISQGLHCTSVCAECIPENTKPRPAASSLVVTHSLIKQLVTSGSLHKSSADFVFPFLNKDCSESFTSPRSPMASLGGRRHFFAAAGQGSTYQPPPRPTPVSLHPPLKDTSLQKKEIVFPGPPAKKSKAGRRWDNSLNGLWSFLTPVSQVRTTMSHATRIPPILIEETPSDSIMNIFLHESEKFLKHWDCEKNMTVPNKHKQLPRGSLKPNNVREIGVTTKGLSGRPDPEG